MTTLAILMALSWLVVIGLVVAAVRFVRGGGLQAAAPVAVVDESEVEARVERRLEADRLQLTRREDELTTRLERLEQQQAELDARRADTDQRRRDAERQAVEAKQAAADAQQQKQAAEEFARQERSDLRALRATLESRERRLTEREERLVAEGRTLETRNTQLVELRASAQRLHDEVTSTREQLRVQQENHERHAAEELQRVAGLDVEAARQEVLARVEHEARLEATALAREIEGAARRDAERLARGIIVDAIQRLAAEQTSESVVSTVDLPSDEMKGRIIGREGRNIRHFEQVTGVNVMIDDTPGSVLLSCFDPVRREIGRLTLAELVADGRIHPARIEEVYERSIDRVEEQCIRAAEDALAEVGISDIDPDLVPVIGALRYRTSYGQNVLRHLVECAHLAGMMAAELGLDVALCKRAAFLHDIGKALTHEVEGTHAMVGADLARRHGESPDVVHAIEAHHNEVEPTTVVAVLTQAADAISGSRPGARRESLEAYVQRLEKLEELALQHDGVDKVFAMQAGREVRVMVQPDQIDDVAAQALARDIAHEIHTELTYPGQIRVTVVRESRATQIAH